MSRSVFCRYLPVTAADGQQAELFTVVCLPEPSGTFPIVIFRHPYMDDTENRTDDEVCARALEAYGNWLDHGYAVVCQHCRGTGKSSGDFVAYIHEREDGLALHEWVRSQPFYGGELYLCGGSYLTSVHYACAPYADDIRGAVLEVQDCNRYNVVYRNGFFKIGLHGGWYVRMFKKKTLRSKSYVPEAFNTLPLSEFSRTVFGERDPVLDETFRHPDPSDPFWTTRTGGADARDAVKNARFPILFVTGFYDIYTGGVFDLWNGLEPATRERCALAVHPYDHSGSPDGKTYVFEGGKLSETYGDHHVAWMDAVRGVGKYPFPQGRVTYYQLFGDRWRTDAFVPGGRMLKFVLGEGERTYTYNPYAPAAFPGGLSANFGGAQFQNKPDARYDVLTYYTPVFDADTAVKGKMTASLTVRSDCEDTCFYVRVSLCKPEGDFGLRDDIQQLSNFYPEYRPGETVKLPFTFDEHAFVVHAGERLRIDVSSSAFPHYVRHTNNRGLYSDQTTARVARNTVCAGLSELTVPAE